MPEHTHSKTVGYTYSDEYIAVEDLSPIQGLSSVNPIILDYYGSEQCTPGYRFGPFVRTSFVLHMVISGCGCLYKGQDTYPVHAGEAFLIYPEEVTTYQADQADPWKYMWIGFHGYKVESMMAQAGFSLTSPVIRLQDIRTVEETMNRLLEAKELTYINELKRMSFLYTLLVLLTEGHQVPARPVLSAADTDHRKYVDAAATILMDTARTHIRISDVARSIGISRSYLTHIFRKELGISPQEFLSAYRMEKAASLLGTTDSPVNVIAAEVGYPDALAFSKAFRKRFDMSPTDYRQLRPQLSMHHKKGEYISSSPL